MCRRPRCSASNRSMDDLPGRPRRPNLRSLPIIFQDSAGASGTGPDAAFGHLPCRSLYASAHWSISGIVIGRRDFPAARAALPHEQARQARPAG